MIARISAWFKKSWQRFASLSRRTQVITGVILLVVIIGIVVWARSGTTASSGNALPTVTVAAVDSFGGNTNGVDVFGTVQSVSQADILAQSAGTVTAVNTMIGATVPAGFVIANLDNSAQSAAVLQAQGAYDAAVAAEQATALQSQNSTGSVAVEQTAVQNTYESTYSTLDSTLSNDVDAFFGQATGVGPALLISPLTTNETLPREREAVKLEMDSYRASLATDSTADPLTLLTNAQSTLNSVSNLLTDLGALADQTEAGATPTQLADLAAARASVNTLLANISSTRTAYNAAVTAAAVGQTQSDAGTDTGVTSSEATVEEALGGLRAAQAAYEKTIIRAPIAGTINFLPIHVGDYVTLNEKVSTVARNNALEVVLELSQDDRNRVAVGDTVTIDANYKGVVTTIAPALDPDTKQIEVHVAVSDPNADLVNGQSVQVALPALPTDAPAAATDSLNASTTPQTLELPLTAVKLLPNERDVFSVDSTGHLVAHQVQIGNVIGDLIQITTPLDPSLEIVTDARGFSAGDAVLVASTTTSGSD